MKKIVPVVLLFLSLTSCGKMKEVNNDSNNSNINSLVSDDKKTSSNVKNNKNSNKQKYEDLSFLDCYKDILNSKLPYRIDGFGGETREWYLDELSSD
ncbi:MAG: hypothetical protein E7E32_06800 [Anaerococcus hydrogenalis]|nr:hypothetical protein [Anaerococcus hydrogenalis]